MRNLQSIKWLVILTLFIITFTYGCATNPVTGKQELMLLSENDEIQMGRTVYPNAMWGAEGGGGEYKDDSLKAYLGDIVQRIHRASHRPNLPVSFAIQNSSVPNAWAIPGYVVITRGLLTGLDNEGEFAFVMGHEMGHVSARHSARQMSQAILLQIGLVTAGAALSNKQQGDIILGLGAVGGMMLLRKYSRDDEYEADRLGVDYMTKIGYAPRNAVSAHRRLQLISEQYARSLGADPRERNFFEELLSTHPRTQTRIEEIERLIVNYRTTQFYGDGSNSQRYKSMTSNIQKVHNVYTNYYDKALRAYEKGNLDMAQNYMNTAINLDKYQAPFYSLTGYIMLDRNNYIEAERYFKGSLVLDKNYQPAYRGFGMISYAQKDYNNAVTHLKKALSLYPEDIASHYYVGMSFYRTNRFDSAIPHLSMVAQTMPKHKTVFGLIGYCYDKIGNVDEAFKYYAQQIKIDTTSNIGKQSLDRYNELTRAIEKTKSEKMQKK